MDGRCILPALKIKEHHELTRKQAFSTKSDWTCGYFQSRARYTRSLSLNGEAWESTHYTNHWKKTSILLSKKIFSHNARDTLYHGKYCHIYIHMYMYTCMDGFVCAYGCDRIIALVRRNSRSQLLLCTHVLHFATLMHTYKATLTAALHAKITTPPHCIWLCNALRALAALPTVASSRRTHTNAH